MSTKSTLDALIAQASAPATASVATPTLADVAAKNGAAITLPVPPKKNARKNGTTTAKPAVPQTTPSGQPLDTVTTVKAGTVGTASTVLDVPGFGLVVVTGLPESVKDAVARATTNPWYPVVEWLAIQAPCFVTITRSDSSNAKSPISKLDAAITRYRKLGGKGYGKLDAKSGTEKGVWYLIRRP